MAEWQPIETAPKDETEVLLYFPERHWQTKKHVVVGFWGSVGEPDAGWYMHEADSRDMEAFGSKATHWMPFPEPPQTSEEG